MPKGRGAKQRAKVLWRKQTKARNQHPRSPSRRRAPSLESSASPAPFSEASSTILSSAGPVAAGPPTLRSHPKRLKILPSPHPVIPDADLSIHKLEPLEFSAARERDLVPDRFEIINNEKNISITVVPPRGGGGGGLDWVGLDWIGLGRGGLLGWCVVPLDPRSWLGKDISTCTRTVHVSKHASVCTSITTGSRAGGGRCACSSRNHGPQNRGIHSLKREQGTVQTTTGPTALRRPVGVSGAVGPLRAQPGPRPTPRIPSYRPP